MDHSFAYGNNFFPYNAQSQRFDLFCELVPKEFMQPIKQDFQQQPPPCFLPYASELQGLTTQVAQLIAGVSKLTGKAEEEKGAVTNEAPLMVAAALEFQEIKCPTTSTTIYSNPSLIYSHSAFNFDDDNSNSLMSDDCMSASVDIFECVCEPYDHNYTDAYFEKLVAGFRELTMIHGCNSFVDVPISEFTTASVQLSENVYYDGDKSTEPQSEIGCTADLNSDLKIEPIEVQTDFRKSKEYLEKIREAVNHVLVLQYYEMDFYADVYAHDDKYAVFEDVKVDRADFENACIDLGLELELEFAECKGKVHYVQAGWK
ncbi:hypothetical protein V8G54_007609 [Vigna mungo]|uniref:Uncharacterized protein n=1 Tax=Vigna mungo TaxID=3915 RepID=A0AAQ3P492_VIGMU